MWVGRNRWFLIRCGIEQINRQRAVDKVGRVKINNAGTVSGDTCNFLGDIGFGMVRQQRLVSRGFGNGVRYRSG